MPLPQTTLPIFWLHDLTCCSSGEKSLETALFLFVNEDGVERKASGGVHNIKSNKQVQS